MDVKVSNFQHDLSEREVKILDVLISNLCAMANFGVVKAPGMLNPLKKEENMIFHTRMVWQSAIAEDVADELRESILRRINNAMTRSEMGEGIDVSVERVVYGGVK